MIKSKRFLAYLAAGMLVLAGIIAGGTMFLRNTSNSNTAPAFPSKYFAPYQDITIETSLQAIMHSTGQKFYTLGFITGNGCNAEWGDNIRLNQAGASLPHLDSDIQAIRSQGGDVIISFGGETGQELAQTCSNVKSLQAQYQAVVDRYHPRRLDFDIEGEQEGDSTTIDRRNQALTALQQANTGLSIDFTLPTETTGLSDSGLSLLNNAVSHGVNFSIVNIMTMDYDTPDNHMGLEAINAANGLFSQLQQIFPSRSSSQIWSMVGITPLIGQNDTPGEIFTLDDASQVLSFAQVHNTGELSFWELSRDNGSCSGNLAELDTCSSITQGTHSFLNTFKSFSGRE